MFRFPISSGFSFSASGSLFWGAGLFFGGLVFCVLFCAGIGAARSMRLNPSHKLRRADGNLIVFLLVSIPASLQPRGGHSMTQCRSTVSGETVGTAYLSASSFNRFVNLLSNFFQSQRSF